MPFLGFAVILACTAPATDSDADTDVATDTDTDATAPDLRVTADDPTAFAGATLGLFPLDTSFFAVLSETPTLAVSPDSDGGFVIAYTPGDDALVDAPWAPGVRVAGYALVAYHDAPDASGLIGITRFDAVWLAGDLPAQFGDIGLHDGWNALRGDDEGPPGVGDPLAVALDANLLAAPGATASGAWSTDVAGLVGALSTEDATIAIGATAATDPWQVDATGEPPMSTRFSTGDATVAGFRLGAFTDADASGGWSPGDVTTAVAVTSDGEPAWLAWGAPVASAHQAHVLVTRGGFRVGWSAVRGTEGSTPLGPTDALTLVPSL